MKTGRVVTEGILKPQPGTTTEEQKEKKLNIAPVREPTPFEPLQTFLPKVSPRGQPIEYKGRKTLTSKIDPGWRDI